MSMEITSQAEATERLLEHQRNMGAIETQPASADTMETDTGWAFFNVNGYLGTVTYNGEVVEEPQFVGLDRDLAHIDE